MKWLSGFHTAPAKSECGGYVVKLLASPEFHYGAFHRPSLYDLIACGPPVPTLDEAKAQAEAHLAKLTESA